MNDTSSLKILKNLIELEGLQDSVDLEETCLAVPLIDLITSKDHLEDLTWAIATVDLTDIHSISGRFCS